LSATHDDSAGFIAAATPTGSTPSGSSKLWRRSITVSDSEPTMPGSRNKGGETMRAEEGDETIGELADEAAKAKKELRESTETGEKVQKQEKAADK
jgi:hypothetical protein